MDDKEFDEMMDGIRERIRQAKEMLIMQMRSRHYSPNTIDDELNTYRRELDGFITTDGKVFNWRKAQKGEPKE